MSTTILLIAKPSQLATLSAYLNGSVLTAGSASEGYEAALQQRPAFIVIDSHLPDLSGAQLSQLLKTDSRLRLCQIILLERTDTSNHCLWKASAFPDACLKQDDRLKHTLPQVIEQLTPLAKDQSTDRPESSQDCRPYLMERLSEGLTIRHINTAFRRLESVTPDVAQLAYLVLSTIESLIDFDIVGFCPFVECESLYDATLYLQSSNEQRFSTDLYERIAQEHHQALQGLSLEGYPKLQVISDSLDDEESEEPLSSLETSLPQPYVQTLSLDGKVVGSVVLYSQAVKPYETLFPLPIIQQELERLLGLVSLHERLKKTQQQDQLTGLLNYEQAMDHLKREFNRAERYELPLTLSVVDIKGLDHFNQRWGARCGNDLLRLVSTLMREAFREADVLTRLSGSMFGVIMPQTTPEEAEAPAKRLAELAGKTPLMVQGEHTPYLLHFSLVSYHEGIKAPRDLLHEALQGLRNQPIQFTEDKTTNPLPPEIAQGS